MRGDLTLGWPPVTTNHLYVRRRSGVHLASRAAAWRDEVILVVRQSGVRVPPPTGSSPSRSPFILELRIRRAPWADPPYLMVEICEAVDVSSR